MKPFRLAPLALKQDDRLPRSVRTARARQALIRNPADDGSVNISVDCWFPFCDKPCCPVGRKATVG